MIRDRMIHSGVGTKLRCTEPCRPHRTDHFPKPAMTKFILHMRPAAAVFFSILIAACGEEKAETMLSSGKEYMAKGDNKAAIIQFKNVLQKNSNQPEARFLLAKAMLDGGDPVNAELEFRKALDQKHPVDAVVPQLARSLLFAGKSKKIVDEFGNTELTSADSRADLLTTVSSAYAALGNRDRAKKTIEAALAAKADFAPAQITQARYAAGDGDVAAALAAIEDVLVKAPANFEAWKFKGDLLLSKNEVESAIAAFRKALELRPSLVGAHFSLITSLFQQRNLAEAGKQLDLMKKAAPRHPQTLYLAAQFAFGNKDYTAAREISQQLLKIAPNSPIGLQQAGAIEYQLKALVQAESYLTRALQAMPDATATRRWLVLTYLGLGQPAKAVDVIAPIAGKIEGDAGMLALAGQAYLQKGDVQKGEEYLAKAAKLDPKDARKQTTLALARMIKGDSDTAFSELERISAGDSGTTADMALIASHMRRGELDKALRSIDVLEKKQPDDPIAPNLRGQVLLAKRDPAGARKSFERALALRPANFQAAASLASLDVADKRPDLAKGRFEAIVAADPKNSQAMLALAELMARSEGLSAAVGAQIGKAVAARPEESGPRLALIDYHLRKKDSKQAVAAGQDAIAAMRDRPEILEALGRAQIASGDFNQGLATYSRLSAGKDVSPKPYLLMAEVQVANKDLGAAAQSLRKALAIKPDLLDAQRGLIMIFLESGQTQEAVTIADQVRKQRPKEAVGYAFEGDIRAARKSWVEAAVAYREGLKIAPGAELAIKLHSVLSASGNRSEADKFAAGWVKDKPKDAGFRFYLGEVATRKKDYAAAVSHYRLLLDTQPENAVLLNNLAWVAGQQKLPGAIDFAEKANKLAPNQPAFMDTLGVLLAEKGEMARGLELLAKAVEIAPQAAGIRLNYAGMLIKAGQKAEARKQLDELTKLGDKFSGQAEVAQMVKDL